MKITKILMLSVLSAFFASCTNNDDVVLLDVESLTVSNLHAPQSGGQGQPVSGDFTKFDFETGQITTSDSDWDIAFRGTSIIVNGGASLGTVDEPTRTGNAAVYIADGPMASVSSI
ncbi:MAG: HmuY family protein, partial [Flavobacteriaceae bacterium]|nr:HmuY family protein [Flavobacteriaceae bacterium]